MMIDAIVTSLDRDNLIVTPSGDADFGSLVGKRVRYRDNSDRIWTGRVVAAEEPYATVKFDAFPTGLGQGQIVQILEEGEKEDAE
ncbi:MAG: hypothetical protein KGH57_04290 [Candidatus Micrarchaeota archaeon]|nr:hypothetical protein [Candidatus Micrarchaeota archaeon]